MRPDNSSISAKVFFSVKVNGSELLVTQQCRLLEQDYNTNFTSALLDEESVVDIKSVFELLEQADLKYIRTEINKKPSLRTLTQSIYWTKLWDIARDHGIQDSRSLLTVLTTLTTPTFTDQECPHCNTIITKEQHFAEHLAQNHLSVSLTGIINMLKNDDKAIFSVGTELKRLRSNPKHLNAINNS